jgi:sugar phosphate isomerase/epimerase
MDISLQLYSLREDEEADFEVALKMCAEAGYQGVEFAGYFGRSPQEMKALLDRYGLKAVSTHAGFDKIRDHLEDEIAMCKGLGYSLIVCPGAPFGTEEEIAESARVLEEAAQKLAREGISLGYHNHSHEFTQFNGRYGLDIFFEKAPSVKMQLDLCWAAHAGLDPVAYIRPYAEAGRVCAIHAKELGRVGGKDTFDAYIGEGVVDFAGVAKLCPATVYPWVVEQEGYHSSRAEGVASCYRNLKALLRV